METMILIALLAGTCGFLAGRRPGDRQKTLPPSPEIKIQLALPAAPESKPKPDPTVEETERKAQQKERENRKQAFERVLEAAGFRVYRTGTDTSSHFDGYFLKLGERIFRPIELDGQCLAYELPRWGKCCESYTLYRLAKPSVVDKEPVPGLGPTVCASCGRVEWDHDDSTDIKDAIGSSINIFPALQTLARRDDQYADYARLAMLERERRTLADRADVVRLEIAQLRGRLPELPGDGPYRSLPAISGSD
jgi:hypothetical protein